MYKKVRSRKLIDAEFVARHGKPALIMADEYGGLFAVICDDHCWLVLHRQTGTGAWSPTTHLFRELFAELITLPLPD